MFSFQVMQGFIGSKHGGCIWIGFKDVLQGAGTAGRIEWVCTLLFGVFVIAVGGWLGGRHGVLLEWGICGWASTVPGCHQP